VVSKLAWSEDLRVGIAEIDDQHKTLITLVNGLDMAMREGRGKDVLGSTIDGLMNYTQVHFATEETYLRSFGYPETSTHIASHNDFIARVDDFRRGFEEDRLMLSLEVMDFLVNWLLNHIKVSDRAYGPYLIERGIA
jgi:hemerythrin